MHEYDLFCLIEYDSEPFSIKVFADETVENLKKSIIKSELNNFHPRDLKLWQVDKPDNQKIDSGGLTNENALKPSQLIRRYWGEEPGIGFIHVYIRILGRWIAVDPPSYCRKSAQSLRYMFTNLVL